MCEIGDILLIDNAKNRKFVGQHPFIVIDDQDGIVRGMYQYDFIGLIMTSGDTEEKKLVRGSNPANYPIEPENKIIDSSISYDNKFAYVETDQFFYFDKSKIRYVHLGKLDADILNMVIDFIEESSENGMSIIQILDKAKKIKLEEEIA